MNSPFVSVTLVGVIVTGVVVTHGTVRPVFVAPKLVEFVVVPAPAFRQTQSAEVLLSLVPVRWKESSVTPACRH